MAYKIVFKKPALKALEEIDEPYYSAIKKAISNLSDNPRPNGYIKLKGREGYRIRVGPYRIVYNIFDNILTVQIVNVGDRKDIYD